MTTEPGTKEPASPSGDAGFRFLREAGLSRQKVRYLRDLAARVHSGELELEALHELTDDEVSRKITAVKGLPSLLGPRPCTLR